MRPCILNTLYAMRIILSNGILSTEKAQKKGGAKAPPLDRPVFKYLEICKNDVKEGLDKFLWGGATVWFSVEGKQAYGPRAMEVQKRRCVGISPYDVHRPCHRRAIRTVEAGHSPMR